MSSNATLSNGSAAASTVSPGASEQFLAGNGCFWGPEDMFRKQFGNKGLIDVQVGYAGGKTPSPSYREVCSGRTGHAEVFRATFDTSRLSYADMVEYFYRSHDASQMNRQGNDIGSQYRSIIITLSDEQARIAREVTDKIQKERYDPKGKRIVTEIVSGDDNRFWPAEDYHQGYLEANPNGYHCPAHRHYW